MVWCEKNQTEVMYIANIICFFFIVCFTLKNVNLKFTKCCDKFKMKVFII